MRIGFFGFASLLMFMLPAGAFAQQSDIQLLRAELDALREEYDNRIALLEQRLAVAEQNARQPDYSTPEATSPAIARGNNPAIGVIFQGYAWNYSEDVDDYAIQGFPFGGEAGPVSEGLGIGETELIMNANVDDKFSAWLTAALALEDGEAVVEVEEAWIEATALPAGFGARFGRFFSSIGYLNTRHSHTWDFADQPLPYQAFLGDQYLDDGVQLRWIAPIDLYVELGGELLRGARYPAAGAADSGFGSYSVFAKLGGDVGTDNSWLAGVSYLDSKAIERASGDEEDPLLFSGDSTLASAQFVWKWAPNGNWKQRNLVLQTELFWRNDDGIYQGPDLAPSAYDVDQQGWYAQAIYQPVPRWRVGGRIDGLSSDDPGPLFADSLLQAPSSDPRRYSFMIDWSNSEFSRLRLQFTSDETRAIDDRQWGLQYIHSIGAHGAHAF
jgi:hypothetical protein